MAPAKRAVSSSGGSGGGANKGATAVQGYRRSPWKLGLLALLTVASAGTLWLVLLWAPKLRRACCFSPCQLDTATHVLFKAKGEPAAMCRVHTAVVGAPDGGKLPVRFSVYNFLRLVWCERQRAFVPPAAAAAAAAAADEQGLERQLRTAAAALASGGIPSSRYVPAEVRGAAAAVYGPNQLNVEVPPMAKLLIRALLQPFCLFQYASVVIWAWQEYYEYSAIILAITLASVVATAWQEHRNLARMALMARFSCPVRVLLGGRRPKRLDSEHLLPGDVVVVETGRLPTDLVLLRGEAVVDEAMLTGEAVSVRKVAWRPDLDGGDGSRDGGGGAYSPQSHAHCTLTGGTTVQAALVGGGAGSVPPLGVVVGVGFDSTKGAMLRSMLAARPSPLQAAFARDALRFIAFMLCLGLAFYAWSIVLLHRLGTPPRLIVLKYLDLITVAVPPALAATLAIATGVAVSRLASSGIFVSSSQHINLAGLVDFVAFDKTGTLTQLGLELAGVAEAAGGQFVGGLRVDARALADRQLQVLLATCHSLSLICRGGGRDSQSGGRLSFGSGRLSFGGGRVSFGGGRFSFGSGRLASGAGDEAPQEQLVGDPLDMQLFAASGWTMQHQDGSHSRHRGGTPPGGGGCGDDASCCASVLPPADWPGLPAPGEAEAPPLTPRALHRPYDVLQRFDFSNSRLRSTVLVRHPDGQLAVYVKGSPEVVASLCDAQSLPADFEGQLLRYTGEGFRVLALGYRLLPAGTAAAAAAAMKQQELEAGLHFGGLAAMRNPLKPDSAGVVRRLQAARLPVAMVTGDHAATAVVVARECGILGPEQPVVSVSSADAAAEPGAAAGVQYSLVCRGGAAAGLTEGDALGRLAAGAAQACVTGAALQQLHSAAAEEGAGGRAAVALEVVLRTSRVYARMSPGDKQLLMVLLGPGDEAGVQEDAAEGEAPAPAAKGFPGLNKAPIFCGDGANDLGALKAALVGVSLCQAEASIAAPMTSRRDSVAAVADAIAEGRCSLATAFMLFQFIMCYAFIQVFGVNLLYQYGLLVGNYQYLIQDLLFCTGLAALMSLTKPCASLSRRQPPSRLVSYQLLLPVLAQFVVVAAFQVGGMLLLKAQPWHQPPDLSEGGPLEQSLAPENTVIFCVNAAQIWISALVFNIGRPFRQPPWTNPGLLAALLAGLGFILYCLFAPLQYGGGEVDTFARHFVGLVPLPLAFRWQLAALVAGNVAAAFVCHLASARAVALVDGAIARCRSTARPPVAEGAAKGEGGSGKRGARGAGRRPWWRAVAPVGGGGGDDDDGCSCCSSGTGTSTGTSTGSGCGGSGSPWGGGKLQLVAPAAAAGGTARSTSTGPGGDLV